MIVANIFLIIGSKNTWNRGKCSLALSLQHCNLQFFDIFKNEVTVSAEKEVDINYLTQENWEENY